MTTPKAYFSLVHLQLEYASIVWSPWQGADIEKLEKVNQRAARFVTNNFIILAVYQNDPSIWVAITRNL